MKKKLENVELDIHNHTIASGHAYGTVSEMINEAYKKKIKLFGITEHGPGIEGTPSSLYFMNIHTIPEKFKSMQVLMGCELNIVNNRGKVELLFFDKDKIDLSLRLAGVHMLFKQGNMKYNNKAYTTVMETGNVDVIVHPDRDINELDYLQLMKDARKYNVLVEVNNASLRLNREHNEPRIREILKASMKLDYPIIVSSDAHYMSDVKNYNFVWKILEEVDFPDDLIINFSKKDFLKIIEKNHICG